MAGLLDADSQSQAAALPFKSSRGCAVPWTQTEVTELASVMFNTLPNEVHRLVSSDAFKGGPIIMLDSVLQSPTRKHLRQNKFWIQAVARVFPATVPSGYFLADALLELNDMLDGNLLKVTDPDVRAGQLTLALQEAAKLKKLIGYLRYLYRATDQSSCPQVAALKALLQKNPRSSIELQNHGPCTLAQINRIPRAYYCYY
jgi:hypothetical protein